MLPGLDMTHNQLFFLNYAQIWCGSMRPEDALTKIRSSVHSPGPVRVLGPLSNSKYVSKENHTVFENFKKFHFPAFWNSYFGFWREKCEKWGFIWKLIWRWNSNIWKRYFFGGKLWIFFFAYSDFSKAYNCPDNSRMNPPKKCSVW